MKWTGTERVRNDQIRSEQLMLGGTQVQTGLTQVPLSRLTFIPIISWRSRRMQKSQMSRTQWRRKWCLVFIVWTYRCTRPRPRVHLHSCQYPPEFPVVTFSWMWLVKSSATVNSRIVTIICESFQLLMVFNVVLTKNKKNKTNCDKKIYGDQTVIQINTRTKLLQIQMQNVDLQNTRWI